MTQPEVTSALPTILPLIPPASVPLDGIVEEATHDFNAGHFSVEEELVRRFVSSLLTKRFVILTGLAGSGKTKLAQAFSEWLEFDIPTPKDPFTPGTMVRGDQKTYLVKSSDSISVECWNDPDPSKAIKVVLPKQLIEEWVNCILQNGFTRQTPAREIRELVGSTTRFSGQINSFETNLKAFAFAFLENTQTEIMGPCSTIVPVGADWAGNENILGYADAIDKTNYVTTQALELILHAEKYPNLPHFLILDEMNLSHVERYFADFLSAIESGKPIILHNDKDVQGKPVSRMDVPSSITFPQNLFVIGTVNIDETTYMFSPKVLDRANVIEFRIEENQLEKYLNNPLGLNLPTGDGRKYAVAFVTAAKIDSPLTGQDQIKFKGEMLLLFSILETYGAEFGFRTSREIARFISYHKTLTTSNWDFNSAFDAQIVQKILPKLHGSRKKLELILYALGAICYSSHDWKPDPSTGIINLTNRAKLLEDAEKSANFDPQSINPLSKKIDGTPEYPQDSAQFPLSYNKITRMLLLLERNGFTSFAEA